MPHEAQSLVLLHAKVLTNQRSMPLNLDFTIKNLLIICEQLRDRVELLFVSK